MKLVDAWIWAENIKMLCERKDDNERVELGVFPNISSITKDANATIYVTKGVLRKLRLVHHIYNGVEFVTKLLKNCDFAAPYKKDKGIINFYRKWTTEHGKARAFLAGLAVKDRTITTCFPPTPTAYKEAEKNKIELK